MPRVKLTLEYDGTDFAGWQIQKNARSVQEVLQTALGKLLGEAVTVASAGRTDSGVHALGQVACFTTGRALPMKAYFRGLTGELPPDLAVVAAEEVDEAFDPRRWSLGKRYRYLISNRKVRSPLLRRTHWELFAPLQVEAMKAAAPLLVGRHDFSAFRAADCQAATAVRELRRVEVTGEAGGALRIEVEGTAFLKHMVRNLVGTLVEVGRGDEPPGWVGEVLAGKDRTRAGATAPPQGLTLVEVFYGPGRPAHVPDPDGEDDA